MVTETYERVAKVMSNVMEVGPSEISRESSPDNLDAWDSMAHVRLIVELEKEFSISIGPDDAVEFESVGMVCDWINSKV